MYKKVYFFLLILVLMYGIIPLKISEVIGSDFLIGDFVDKNLFSDLMMLTLGSAFFLSPMLKTNIATPSFNVYGKFSEKMGYYIYFFYLIFLVFLGLFLRLMGTERGVLLEILSSTFLQGMGIVMALFYLKFIKSDKKNIITIAVMFCIIDILFMGKQYFISLITVLIFLADYHSYKIKLFHLLIIFGASVLFIFIINFSRGDFSQIDLFSSLMEFRGVISSIQFASPNVSIFDLNDFRAKVARECFDNFGYNLAFHPLMYLRSITAYTSLNIVIYSVLVFSVFKLMVRLLGAYAVLIVALNFIHFLRHGIDLFLIKIVFQSAIVLLFRINFDLEIKDFFNNSEIKHKHI